MNHLRVPLAKSRRPRTVVRFLFNGDVSLPAYSQFLTAGLVRNDQFFQSIFEEMMFSVFYRARNEFLPSFLHLYRTLELISIAFPMLYTSLEKDFKRSHDFLKTLVASDRDGDLKIFERSITFIANDQNYRRMQFLFDVRTVGAPADGALYSEIKRVIGSETIGTKIDWDDINLEFKVNFDNMSSFIAALRNRMFHYRVSEINIGVAASHGSDTVCRLVIDEMINWFGLLYVEMIRVLVRRWG